MSEKANNKPENKPENKQENKQETNEKKIKERQQQLENQKVKDEVDVTINETKPYIDIIINEIRGKIDIRDLEGYRNGYFSMLVNKFEGNLEKLQKASTNEERLKYINEITQNKEDFKIFKNNIFEKFNQEQFEAKLKTFFASSQSKFSVEDYIYKIFRIGFSILSLKIASNYIDSVYIYNVIGNDTAPPTLATFVGFALILDIAMNACFFILINLLSQKSEQIKTLFEDNKKILIYDYVGTIILFGIIATSLSTIIENKRYFRYREDGSRAIRGFEKMLDYIVIVLHLIPFSTIIINLIGTSNASHLYDVLQDKLKKLSIMKNNLDSIRSVTKKGLNQSKDAKNLLKELINDFTSYNNKLRKGKKEEELSKYRKQELDKLKENIKEIEDIKSRIDNFYYTSSSPLLLANKNIFNILLKHGKPVEINIELSSSGLTDSLASFKITSEEHKNKYKEILKDILENKFKNDGYDDDKMRKKVKEKIISEKIGENLKDADKINTEKINTDRIKKDIEKNFDNIKRKIKEALEHKKREYQSELTEIEKLIKDRAKEISNSIKGGNKDIYILERNDIQKKLEVIYDKVDILDRLLEQTLNQTQVDLI